MFIQILPAGIGRLTAEIGRDLLAGLDQALHGFGRILEGGALGAIEVRELTPELAQSLGVPSSVRGVVVTRVGAENGAGGLRPGDVIEAVNQEPVASLRDYQQVVQSLDPNQAQVLSVCRQRSRSFVVVKPG
jgi:serine protease Do